MFNYNKVLARNVNKHIKSQQESLARSLKEGWQFTARKFQWSLPYYKRLGVFKSSTGRVTFDPNTCVARSYDHWCFVKVIKGKVVFNDYGYSNTTRKHQNVVRSLMCELGIKIDVRVYQRESLDRGIVLDHLYRSIELHKIHAECKGARQKTKLEAPKVIKSIQKDIAALKKLGGEMHSTISYIRETEKTNEVYRLERVKRKREEWKLKNAEMLKKKEYNKDFSGWVNKPELRLVK